MPDREKQHEAQQRAVREAALSYLKQESQTGTSPDELRERRNAALRQLAGACEFGLTAGDLQQAKLKRMEAGRNCDADG